MPAHFDKLSANGGKDPVGLCQSKPIGGVP